MQRNFRRLRSLFLSTMVCSACNQRVYHRTDLPQVTRGIQHYRACVWFHWFALLAVCTFNTSTMNNNQKYNQHSHAADVSVSAQNMNTVVWLAFNLPSVVVTLPLGRLADERGRRPILLWYECAFNYQHAALSTINVPFLTIDGVLQVYSDTMCRQCQYAGSLSLWPRSVLDHATFFR